MNNFTIASDRYTGGKSKFSEYEFVEHLVEAGALNDLLFSECGILDGGMFYIIILVDHYIILNLVLT